MRYLALLLFHDGRTVAVDLGPAEPIDRASMRLHDALAHQSVSYLPAAQSLYTLAFRPLVPHLGEAQRLFLTPDGQLNLVPFAALHDGKRFLVDAFHITYLTSGKDLLPRSKGLPSTSAVVVMADPTFSSPPAVPSPQAQPPPELAARSASLERFFSNLRSEEMDIPWAALPGTRKEAEAIHRLFPQAQLLLGPEATKQALLKLSSPTLLHIATHGFFLEDDPSSSGSRGVAHFGAVSAGPPAHPADPLLRSGLVLAGVPPSAAQPGLHHAEGSLVTALELAGLNLWGTQLVVLSACDTGRGDVKLGDGVYGLRRAFLVAGAETLVTSLWKVNDETTSQLMEAYYRALLSGQGRTEALRQAMQTLRQKQSHPHFWAPFVAIGLDAPLELLTKVRFEGL
jgi:CHAT domain-containing protein